jgi:transcriptional regulator with XRE-family HTH domain
MSNIGSNIRKVRELKNFTQEYVAKKLGVSRSFYIKVENNETQIKFEHLHELSQIMNVKLNDIIDFNNKQIFSDSNSQLKEQDLVNNVSGNQHEDLKRLYEQLLTEKDARLQEKDEIIKMMKSLIDKFKIK